MKKVLSLVTALLLACSLALFAACSGSGNPADTGKIDGDYKDATSAELSAELAKIDFDKLLGDTEAEDWKFGIQADADFTVNGKIGTDEISVSSELSYLLDFANGEDGAFDMKGSGSLSATVKLPADLADGTDVDFQATATAYNDAEYFYVSATGKNNGEDEEPVKGKIALEDVMSMIGGYLPMAMDAEDSSSLLTVVAMLDAYGVKVAMDTSDGLKIRLTATEATFNAVAETVFGMMIGTMDEDDAETPSVSDYIEFTKTVLELYIHIDKDGKFAAVSANIDVAVALNEALFDGDEATFSLKGTFAVQATDKTVTLPSDLDTYEDDLLMM